MQRLLEQRAVIKFCVQLKKTGVETLSMIWEAFGDETMSQTRVYDWHKQFREGRESIEDDERAGRLSTSKTEENVKVREVLNSDRRLSVRLIADKCNMSKDSVHRILTEDLQMRKICAKMVPKVLTDQRKENRVEVSQDVLERSESDPRLFDRVITGDETWIFEYDPESKRQSSEWHTMTSPRRKKVRMSKSKIEARLILFFDCKGVIHREFVPAGQTVNKQLLVHPKTVA